jgi:hypothetical protein
MRISYVSIEIKCALALFLLFATVFLIIKTLRVLFDKNVRQSLFKRCQNVSKDKVVYSKGIWIEDDFRFENHPWILIQLTIFCLSFTILLILNIIGVF